MSDDSGAEDAPYSPAETARAWLVKMRGEDAAALREEFEEWLGASPENRAAYDVAGRRFVQGEALKTSVRYGPRRFDPWGFVQARRWQLVGTAAAAAALLVFAIGAGGVPLPGPVQPGAATAYAAVPLVTKRGEIRSFRLADGSTAILDTDSAAEVSMNGDERRLRLSRGRARLTIIADARPFRIDTPVNVITAGEAMIDVGYEDGALSVELARGAATIHPAAAGPSAGAPLPVARPVRYAAVDGTAREGAGFGPRSTADWTMGWTEHRSVRLDKLVEEANRYAAQPIIVDEPELAGRQISGRFRIADTDTFVEGLAKLLDLSVDRRAGAIHLRRR